jgi:hypothetical protein
MTAQGLLFQTVEQIVDIMFYIVLQRKQSARVAKVGSRELTGPEGRSGEGLAFLSRRLRKRPTACLDMVWLSVQCHQDSGSIGERDLRGELGE